MEEACEDKGAAHRDVVVRDDRDGALLVHLRRQDLRLDGGVLAAEADVLALLADEEVVQRRLATST